MERYRYSVLEQLFLEDSPIPFVVYQVINGKIVTVTLSKGFIEIHGYAAMTKQAVYDMLDKDLYRDIHPDDRATVENATKRFALENAKFDIEYRFNKNGEYRLIHAQAEHIYKGNGVLLNCVWFMDLGLDEEDAKKKVEELKRSVSALLTNMPALTFSKDVHTRKYLACNQAFAEYAHKETPEGVVGLTDFEIFDEETAYHFIEDDKKALAMDKPYIFFEDVPDAEGNPRQFQTTKLKFTDDTGRECLLGLCQDVTDAMRIKREYVQKLAVVQSRAEIDALTGIKNKNAYKEREDLMNRRIIEGRQPEFAIIVLDVNDLKTINDTLGHEAGDKCICDACDIICSTFKRSPVYRVGGDEFVVISQDEDYFHTDELVDLINKHNDSAIVTGGIVIACGAAKFDDDDSVLSVFNRADKNMYENKSSLKKRKAKYLVNDV